MLKNNADVLGYGQEIKLEFVNQDGTWTVTDEPTEETSTRSKRLARLVNVPLS